MQRLSSLRNGLLYPASGSGQYESIGHQNIQRWSGDRCLQTGGLYSVQTDALHGWWPAGSGEISFPVCLGKILFRILSLSCDFSMEWWHLPLRFVRRSCPMRECLQYRCDPTLWQRPSEGRLTIGEWRLTNWLFLRLDRFLQLLRLLHLLRFLRLERLLRLLRFQRINESTNSLIL